jgi:hypothetical protein
MKDLTKYATAKPTATMEAFADYLIAEVYGGTLPKGVNEASFRIGVALGGSTRGYFQSSEAWKTDPRNYLANVEKNRAAKIEAAKERAEVSKRKAEERLAALEAKLADAVAAAKAKAEALAEVDESEAPGRDAKREAEIARAAATEDAKRAEAGAGPIVPVTDANAA